MRPLVGARYAALGIPDDRFINRRIKCVGCRVAQVHLDGVGAQMQPLGDLPVHRVHLHGHVGIGHDRLATNRRIFDIDRLVFFLDVDGLPLPGAGWAFFQFPLMFEQQVEITIVPLGRRRRPCTFDAAGYRVAANAALGLVDPTQSLLFKAGGFGFRAKQRGVAGAMAFAHRVAAGGEGNGLLVVHGHAGKGLADVTARRHGIRVAVRAFRIHVDQAHLDRSQRPFQLPLALVTLVGQPFFLGAPVHEVGFPIVFSTTGKSERLEAHVFERNVGHADLEAGQVPYLERIQLVAIEGGNGQRYIRKARSGTFS